MIFKKLKLEDSYLIEMEKNEDSRGFFSRIYCKDEFKKNNIDFNIVQTSISYNRYKNTVRGLHHQIEPHEEAKLIYCIKGSIYDVIIDLRKYSPTYKEHFTTILTDENYKILYIPEGIIHGFQTLKDNTIVIYYMNEFYNPDFSKKINWKSPEFNIKWPDENVIISDKDRDAPYFFDI